MRPVLKSFFRFRFAVALTALLALFGTAAAATATVRFGSTPIAVPIPEGFVERTAEDSLTIAQLALVMQLVTPLKTAFITEEDANGSAPDLDRHILVCSHIGVNDADTVDDAAFLLAKLATKFLLMNDSDGERLDRDARRFLRSLNIDLSTTYARDDGDALIAYSATPTSSIATAFTYGGMAMVHVKGKLLTLYVNSALTDSSDIAWVKSQTRDLVDAILSANR